jgi:hypothetical protein
LPASEGAKVNFSGKLFKASQYGIKPDRSVSKISVKTCHRDG